MPTFDEYRVLSVADRLSRVRRTPGELDEAIADRDDAELGRRPDARNWSAKEIICHLRDVEELFQVRTDLASTLVREGEFTEPAPGLTVYAQSVDSKGDFRNHQGATRDTAAARKSSSAVFE